MGTKRLHCGLALFALLALVIMPASAHHSISSEFDLFKAFDVIGVLTKVDWINPHGFLYLDVKSEDGTIEHWALEAPPPSVWRRAGVATRDYLPIGKTYTIRAASAKNGSKSGLVLVITMPDGKKLSVLGAGQNPSAP